MTICEERGYHNFTTPEVITDSFEEVEIIGGCKDCNAFFNLSGEWRDKGEDNGAD